MNDPFLTFDEWSVVALVFIVCIVGSIRAGMAYERHRQRIREEIAERVIMQEALNGKHS